MIRILDQMILRSFLKIFGGFVLGAPLLFIVGDLVENVDTYLERGLPAAAVALALLYKVPEFMSWSFPIAGLMAAIFTIHSMTTHREVMAAKAGGISFRRLVLPLAAIGTLLTGMGFGLSEIVPVANRRAGLILKDVDIRRQWRTDFVYETDDGWTLSVRRLTAANGQMSEVILEVPPQREGGPTRHVQADAAHWGSETGWTFTDGYVRIVPEFGEPTTFQFVEYRTRGLDLEPAQLLEEPRAKEEMRAAEITRQAEIIRRSGGNPNRFILEREERFAIAAATLIIILFGAPLATSSRRGGAAYGVGMALGSTILYMLAFRLSVAAGESGALPPVPAAWIPNALFLLSAVLLLGRVRT